MGYDKINVFILEDELDHLAIAKAGLLPNVPENLEDVDPKYRIKLSDENFSIVHAYSLQEAMDKLIKLTPDLFIIDINLSGEEYNYKGTPLKNGIDFYNHIEKRMPSSKLILFSSRFSTPNYFKRLSPKQKDHLIPKSTSGVGYANLSASIAEYLEKIAIAIAKQALPETKKRIANDLSDLDDKDFKNIEEYPYAFGKRKMKPKHLLLHCSYPILVKSGKKNSGSLKYNNPISAFKGLINQVDISGGEKFRERWKAPHIQNALEDYHGKFLSKYENDNVIPGTKQIIGNLIKNISHDPDKRLVGLGFGQYRTKEYTGHTLEMNNTFRVKLINALIVRRVFLTLELFTRENIDSNGKLQPLFRDFFKGFVNEILKGLKFRSEPLSPTELGQAETELNLGFKTDTKDNLRREKVEIENWVIFDCEKEWFESDEYRAIKEELKRNVLQSPR